MSLNTLLEKNAEWAKTWKNPFDMGERHAAAVQSGSTTIRDTDSSKIQAGLILTCLDPRCVPEQFFGPGLRLGVIRNAGGRATQDAINSITTIRALLGLGTVIVVHHTDCGMSHLTESEIRTTTLSRTPDAATEIDQVASFGCFTPDGFEDAIKADVRTLRAAKVLKGLPVKGVALDLGTGIARELDV